MIILSFYCDVEWSHNHKCPAFIFAPLYAGLTKTQYSTNYSAELSDFFKPEKQRTIN